MSNNVVQIEKSSVKKAGFDSLSKKKQEEYKLMHRNMASMLFGVYMIIDYVIKRHDFNREAISNVGDYVKQLDDQSCEAIVSESMLFMGMFMDIYRRLKKIQKAINK